jgi:Contractile injection system tube protein
MTGLTSSPQLIKGGLVVLAPGGGTVRRQIALQYNPDTLSRSYQVQGVGGDGGGGARAQPFRLKGPAIETIKLDAEIDATDQLADPDAHATAVAFGIAPQLAVLEALVNPSVDELLGVAAQGDSGTLEILPPEAPLVLFVWGKNRIAPVRVAEFSIVEEAFDPALNPIRAKVSLGLHVMSTDDLGFAHRGGTIFLNYLRTREALAGLTGGASLASLGLTSLP